MVFRSTRREESGASVRKTVRENVLTYLGKWERRLVKGWQVLGGQANRQVVRAVDPEMLSVHVGLDSWMEGSGTGE